MLFEWIILVATIATSIVYIYIWLKKRRDAYYETSSLLDQFGSFFPVLLIVFILRSFIIEPFRIPSGSMTPSLLDGDFIFVNKHSYGIRLPISGKKIFDVAMPDRGQMAVFRLPSDRSIVYVKRVIGLPGDIIYYDYQSKNLFINDVLVEKLELGYYMNDKNLLVSEENYGNKHQIIHMNNRLSLGGTYEVPEGHYFMMGDNRDNSQDSRFDVVGFVPEDNFVGRPAFIWMHWNSDDLDTFKWDRIGFISDGS
jgi:signal peptidase I